MSPSRRDLLRSLAGVAVALPVATLAPMTAPSASAAAPNHWNSVQLDRDPKRSHQTALSWHADAHAFVYSTGLNRVVARQLHIQAYVDGSMRLCIAPTGAFDRLPIDKGFAAIYLAPDLAQEVYQGLFAESPADVMPVEPARRRVWSDEAFRWRLEQTRRMRLYVDTEEIFPGETPPLTPFDNGPLLDDDED